MDTMDVRMKTRILFTHAEDLLAPPRRWTRGAFARAGDGHEVHYLDPDARRWSAAGAVLRTGAVLASMAIPRDRDAWYDATQHALVELARAAGADVAAFRDVTDATRAIHQYNDTHTKRAVLALFERARHALDERLNA
jgi:hypothetical protein